MGTVPRSLVDIPMMMLAPPIIDNLYDYVMELQITMSVYCRAAHGEVTSHYDGYTNLFQPGN